MQKFSMTATLEADSEIVAEEDDKGLKLELPARFTSRAPFRIFWGEAPTLLKVEYFYLSDSQFCLYFHT